jgi:hypothetical protein
MRRASLGRGVNLEEPASESWVKPTLVQVAHAGRTTWVPIAITGRGVPLYPENLRSLGEVIGYEIVGRRLDSGHPKEEKPSRADGYRFRYGSSNQPKWVVDVRRLDPEVHRQAYGRLSAVSGRLTS